MFNSDNITYEIVDFGLWILDCGFWIVDFGLWILDCGLGLLILNFTQLSVVLFLKIGIRIKDEG
ncbi:hypothetical protein F7734_41515 [Scytonema sp. UIC 10036]|uniref:hypothetical protein n=1 Tax=Scytonema sp. UIC 10036 TaxID=2304196 RepID=UPI0012DAA949|nr:hypothetical protein [Scytonema sp. UIC 10036]MUG98438.1 hypothetical protein [Scytonema sp. UIC 10036]